ncbi:MAG: alpha/beta hydrolase family protein [Promethearchaeota archaeon]
MEAFEKIDKLIQAYISGHSVRKILLITTFILLGIGTILAVVGTFSPYYTIKRVKFTNKTFYEKAELYGDTYLEETYGPEYEGISLKPEQNQIFTINAYEITPTKKPSSGKFPTIIWSHGMIANNEIQLHYALEFAAAGFKVIAMGLEGHGSNGGLWDLGITDWQVFYAAVEYAASLPDVNTSAIGVSGHSNGGFGAARAGIFDKSPLGTGGLISSVASIWCLSDFQETLEELVGDNPVNDPDYSWVLPQFMGSPNNVITKEDVLQRSVSDYINTTNIPNWLLISGTKDQFSSDKVMYHVMSNATGKSMEYLRNQVENDQKNTWDNLNEDQISFDNGTARRLVIEPGLDHIIEAFSVRMPQEIIDWFVLSMHLDPNEHKSRWEKGEPVLFYWFSRFIGMSLLILSLILSQLVVIVYLAPVMFPKQRLTEKILKHKEETYLKMSEIDIGYITPGLQEFLLDVELERRRDLFTLFRLNWKSKTLFWAILTFIFFISVVIFWRIVNYLPRFTRFWVFNAYLWQFIIIGALVWILALATLLFYKKSKKYGRHVDLKRIGGTWKGLGKGFIFTAIVVFAPTIIVNLLLYSLALPFFMPRPFDWNLVGELIIGCMIILFLYVPLETLVKTQLFPVATKFKTKRGYWLEIILNAALVFFIWVFAYGVGSLTMDPKLVRMLFGGTFGGFLFLAIVSMKPIINGGLTYVTALIYQRTRNVFACSFYPLFVWMLIIFGKFAGIYAMF